MKTPSGTVIQAGMPMKARKAGDAKTSGLLLRGVVMATYVTDDPNHPSFADMVNPPSAVYCDVCVYPSIAGQRWFAFSKVLVTQKRGGLHDEELWVPKATKTNILGVLNEGQGANPASFDGDHVLIGFLNNSFDEPIILRGLPHPSKDVGNDLYASGKRTKLKLADGNPDFCKHNGVFRGVDQYGNHIIDTTYGNIGQLLAAGVEPPPDVTGISGNQTQKLPQESTYDVVFYNMAAPIVPIEVARFSCKKDMFEILLTFLPTLKVEGSALTAKLTLGSGAVSAAIAEHLQTLWGQLNTWLNVTHVHPTGTGPSGPATPTSALSPTWDTSINSGKLTFPDG